MTPQPNKRIWTIVAACVVAAAILAVTWKLGGPGGGGSSAEQSGITILPGELPGSGDGSDVVRGKGLEITQQQNGRELFFKAERAEPTDENTNLVEKPVVRVFFEGRQRHLELRADRGTVYMPAKSPQSGRFSGNVWLTFYEPPIEGQTPDWDDLDQVVMHVRLDDAEFDLQEGRIYSRSPLDLYTLDSEFHGVGLELIFNQVRNRLQYLRIDKGDFLRVHQPVADAQSPTKPDRATNTGRPRGQAVAVGNGEVGDANTNAKLRNNQPRSNQKNNTDQVAKAPATAPAPPQYYEATFDTNVTIDTLDNAYALSGDRLTLLFGVEPDADSDKQSAFGGLGLARPIATPMLATNRAVRGSSDPWRVDDWGSSLSSTGARSGGWSPALDDQATSAGTAQASALGREALASITAKGPKDVVLRWQGPMVIRPIPNQPTELTDPKDLAVALSGQKASLRTLEGQVITGASLAYQRNRQRIQAEASPNQAVRLVSPGDGTLVGGDLSIDGLTGQGFMQGPVRLVASTQGLEQAEENNTVSEALPDAGSDAAVAAGNASETAGGTESTDAVAATEANQADDEVAGKVAGESAPSDLPSQWLLAEDWQQDGLAAGLTQDSPVLLARAEGGLAFRLASLSEAKLPAAERAQARRERRAALRGGESDNPFKDMRLQMVELQTGVQVIEPRLVAEAERLVLAFAIDQKDESQLRAITAEDNVTIWLDEGKSGQAQALCVSGDWLKVVLGVDADQGTASESDDLLLAHGDKLQLERLQVRGDVTVSADALLLDTALLDARFAEDADGDLTLVRAWAFDGFEACLLPDAMPKEGKKTGSDADEKDGGLQGPAWVSGERFVLVPADETFVALGTAAAPARMVHRGGRLVGEAVAMDAASGRAAVLGQGEGRLPTPENEPNADTVAAADADNAEAVASVGAADATPDSLGVRWQRGLVVDEQAGFGLLIGQAQGWRSSPLEDARLQGQLIRLEMDPKRPADADAVAAVDANSPWAPIRIAQAKAAEADAAAVETANASDGPAAEQTPDGFASGLKRVVAMGDAEIFGRQLAKAVKPGETADPTSRLLVRASRIVADLLRETITVPGDGNMLIEDYRQATLASAAQASSVSEAEAANTGTASPDDTPAKAGFGDGGATSLSWKNRMVLDARTNDALLEGQVAMVHAPLLPSNQLDYDNVTQANCQRLYVDFVETGGLGMWSSDQGTQPEIRLLACDGNVRLINGPRRVLADHLRYTASQETVWFIPDGDGVVRIEDQSQGTGRDHEWVKWYLPTNHLAGTPTGPGIVPIPAPRN